MKLSQEALDAFSRHAVSVWPAECCGIISNDKYIPMQNIAEDVFKTFKMDPVELAKLNGSIHAILHTHPYDSANPPKHPAQWPSTADMKCWMTNNCPWGIAACDGEGVSQLVWLDEEHPEPLIGREFIHGINDCYSLVRDWFRMNYDVVIPNYPRGMEWWEDGKDLYSENFAKAGFTEVDKKDVRIGDCVLIKVMSPVINHAGVITGDNELLHHVFHRLSGRDRLDKWQYKIEKFVRYTGIKE